MAAERAILPAVAATHFCVDFACIFLVVALLPLENWVFYAVLYNFCAFALQLPLGLICDIRAARLFPAVAGCLLVAAAYPLVGLSAVFATVIAGVGNALFHLGGGITVMRRFPRSVAPWGIFVSPGALGVFFGYFLGNKGMPLSWFFPCIMIFCAVVIAAIRRRSGGETAAPARRFAVGDVAAVCGGLMLFAAVVLRSHFGDVVAFTWKTGFWLPLTFVCGVALGKALGGFVADRLGVANSALATLSLSSLFFLFAEGSPAAGIVAICLFNMTMPLTLFALARVCGDFKGFAFGLTTFALFLGTLPSLSPSSLSTGEPRFLVPIVLLSAALIFFGVVLSGKARR